MNRLEIQEAEHAKKRARKRAGKFFDVATLWNELGRLSLPVPGLTSKPTPRRWWMVDWPFGRNRDPLKLTAAQAKAAAAKARAREFRAAFWNKVQAR